MEQTLHTLICVLGRTACGKDSLVNTVCERTGTKQLISYTTRERRPGEKDTHYFVTEAEYQQMYDAKQIAAYTKIGDYRYWSTVSQLYDSNFYVIDPIGVQTLRELHLSDIRIVTVYIYLPDDVREHRALDLRGDDKTKYRVRNFNEREQFRDVEKNMDYDYAIRNLDFAKSYSVLRWISTVEGAITCPTKGDDT